MSNYNVVFGTRRVARATGGYQKFPENAVVTVEGRAEKGKNRRLLFNKNSMDVLNLEDGISQELVLVFIESDENGSRRLLIANTSGSKLDSAIPTYTTSKSRTAAYKESKEKGKSVTGKALLEEIADFLSVDSTTENEYYINKFDAPEGFPSAGLNLFEFVNVEGTGHAANINVIAESEGNDTKSEDDIPVGPGPGHDEIVDKTTSDEEVTPIVIDEKNGTVIESDEVTDEFDTKSDDAAQSGVKDRFQ